MSEQGLTLVVITLTAVLLIVYDIWVCATAGSASTISWTLWTTSQHYPIIPFAFGILFGHLFWVQQTGRPWPSKGD